MLQEPRFRYCAFPCAFKINPCLQPLGVNVTIQKTLHHFHDVDCTYTVPVFLLEQSCSTEVWLWKCCCRAEAVPTSLVPALHISLYTKTPYCKLHKLSLERRPFTSFGPSVQSPFSMPQLTKRCLQNIYVVLN